MEYGLVEPLERKEGVSNSYQTMMAKEQFVKQAVPQVFSLRARSGTYLLRVWVSKTPAILIKRLPVVLLPPRRLLFAPLPLFPAPAQDIGKY